MSILWYVLTTILCIEAFITTRSAIRFRKFLLSRLKPMDLQESPKVALLVPCKGVDPNLKENIQSWLDQNYPNFEVFVVVESESDGAVPLLKECESLKLFVAGNAEDCGQKIHNLAFVIQKLPEEFEVLVFADSDGRLNEGWLTSLLHDYFCIAMML